MVNAQNPPQYRGTTQIINRQISTPLVLVLQKREPPALARFFVPHEVDVHWFAVLREDGYDVAFGEVEGEPADVDVGCVAVIGVPGCFGGPICIVRG